MDVIKVGPYHLFALHMETRVHMSLNEQKIMIAIQTPS